MGCFPVIGNLGKQNNIDIKFLSLFAQFFIVVEVEKFLFGLGPNCLNFFSKVIVLLNF